MFGCIISGRSLELALWRADDFGPKAGMMPIWSRFKEILRNLYAVD